MPRRNPRSPRPSRLNPAAASPSAHTPSLEARLEHDIIRALDSDEERVCPQCDDTIDGEDEYHRVIVGRGQIQIWCQACGEQNSFYCTDCETDYSLEHITHYDYHGDTVCEFCSNDNYAQCENCDRIEHNDDLAVGRLRLDDVEQDIDLCRDCREGDFFRDEVSQRYYLRAQYGSRGIAGGREILQAFVSSHPDRFTTCAGNHVSLVFLDLRWSYVTHSGQIFSREYAVGQGWTVPPIPAYSDSRPSFSHALRQAYPRGRTLQELRQNLKQAIIQRMSDRPSPTASPVHDKVYVGIELEAQAGQYFVEAPHLQLDKELPTTKLVRDGSIRGEGWEFLPPVIKRVKDWDTIKKMVETLTQFGWHADQTCGLHFHLSHGDLNADNPQVVRNIFRMFYWLEPIIFHCLPASRTDNKFCYPISKYFSEKDMGQNLKLDWWYYSNFWKKQIRRSDGNSRQPHFRFNQDGAAIDTIDFGSGKYTAKNMDIDKKEHYYVGRYIGCNLHALFQKGTLELRYFPAQLNYDYIKNWAQIVCIMVKYGLAQKPIEPIIELSKTRGNLEKAIKELGKLLDLPESLAAFLKMEYRKYAKDEEEQPPAPVTPRPFVSVHSDFRSLGDSLPPSSNSDGPYPSNYQSNNMMIRRTDGMVFEFTEPQVIALTHYINNNGLPSNEIDVEYALTAQRELADRWGTDLDMLAVHAYINHLVRQRRQTEANQRPSPYDIRQSYDSGPTTANFR